MDETNGFDFLSSLQQLGEDFILHFHIAGERYEKDGFPALVEMVRNAPHEFPVKAQKIYQATAIAFMLHCPEEMQGFNQKMLEACPNDATSGAWRNAINRLLMRQIER